ncbi:IS21 family transposase [bacterium]|nr:IS21 family transposase [bacterium]
MDFGRGAPVLDAQGRRRYPHVLRVILSHSRKGYSEAMWHQTTEGFIRGLENAFRHFGGVVRTLVIDNLRAAVSKADWFDPELNPKLEAFCRHYGTVVLPTRPYMPRHKGKVERGVGYVRDNGLKGHVFHSLEEKNLHLLNWETQVADHRIHGTTRRQVKHLFEEHEQAVLLPLPADPFPFFHEAQRCVHRDAHVELEKAYYSVPPECLGREVWVRWDIRMVHIFNRRMEQIAVHLKAQKGHFSTHPAHIASEKISAVERGAETLLRRARVVGPGTGRWAEAMLQERGIQGIRVLQGLLAMVGKHKARALDQACQLALTHGAFRLRDLRYLMKRPTKQESPPFMEEHPIIRNLSDYGSIVRVSLRIEGKTNGANEHEFCAFGDADGSPSAKEPDTRSSSPAVYPPAAALELLSSSALSSGPARKAYQKQAFGQVPKARGRLFSPLDRYLSWMCPCG